MSSIARFTVMFLVMIVFLEFVGISTGLSSTLSTFGIDITDGELESADLGGSTLWINEMLSILTAIALAGVIIGLFAKGYDPSLVVVPLIIFISGLLVSTSWKIILYTNGLGASWLTKIVAVVFIGLGIGFIWSCVDYFRSGT